MPKNITRRTFLAAGAGVLASANAHGLARPVSPNGRIRLGFIGMGGMGRSHFDRLLRRTDVELVALADPDRRHQSAAVEHARAAGASVSAYTRYHELLSMHPDIDAVFVSTPDHWHALATIDCVEAGKDVYVEKPLALTIAEGRRMIEVARRYGRVVQMGTMQRSDMPQFRKACELVRGGAIGEVRGAVCFIGPNPQHAPIPDTAPPDYLDWDLWLGPAPERAYNEKMHPHSWRYFRDYSGGLLTDWGVHLFDIAQWGLGKDETSPVFVRPDQTRYYGENLFEFPEVSRLTYQYGDGITIEWQQGTHDQQEQRIERGHGYGTRFYGSEGELFVNRSALIGHHQDGTRWNEQPGQGDLPPSDSTRHHDDFFDAMRTRNTPVCDVAIGHRATAVAQLGHIATVLNRELRYDPETEVFENDPAANRLLARPLRAPWRW